MRLSYGQIYITLQCGPAAQCSELNVISFKVNSHCAFASGALISARPWVRQRRWCNRWGGVALCRARSTWHWTIIVFLVFSNWPWASEDRPGGRPSPSCQSVLYKEEGNCNLEKWRWSDWLRNGLRRSPGYSEAKLFSSVDVPSIQSDHRLWVIRRWTINICLETLQIFQMFNKLY